MTLQFIESITREAGAVTLEWFGKSSVQYTKEGPADVVTEADLASNKILTDHIRAAYPDHGIISEETPAEREGAAYVWVIDPLDGTRNFSTSTPLYGVMVALVHRSDVILSAIYLPYMDEMFLAEKGKGATLNGQPIHCSETKEWANSFGCGAASWKPGRVEWQKRFATLADQTPFWCSGFGSMAVCAAYVACGRRDWQASSGIGLWDYTPSALLLQESGCIVTDTKGDPWHYPERSFVAANPYLHPQLLAIVRSAPGE